MSVACGADGDRRGAGARGGASPASPSGRRAALAAGAGVAVAGVAAAGRVGRAEAASVQLERAGAVPKTTSSSIARGSPSGSSSPRGGGAAKKVGAKAGIPAEEIPMSPVDGRDLPDTLVRAVDSGPYRWGLKQSGSTLGYEAECPAEFTAGVLGIESRASGGFLGSTAKCIVVTGTLQNQTREVLGRGKIIGKIYDADGVNVYARRSCRDVNPVLGALTCRERDPYWSGAITGNLKPGANELRVRVTVPADVKEPLTFSDDFVCIAWPPSSFGA